MRRIGILLVAVFVASTGTVAAQPARASAKATAAAKSTPTPASRSTKPVAPIGKATKDAKSKVPAKDAKKVDAKDGKQGDAKAIASDAPITMSAGEREADDTTFVQADEAIAMSDVGMTDQVRVKIPDKVSAAELMTQYQRVGRSLMLLQRERGAQVGVETEAAKLSCGDIEKSFKLIKINDAIATADSRIATSVLLMQIGAKIERLRGIALTNECLNNPLAKECL